MAEGFDLTIRGADDVDALVKRIRTHADAKAIRRDLFKGLNGLGKQVRGSMVEIIPAALPNRGGLAAEMQAKLRSRTTAKSGKYAGVSMRFSAKGYDVRTLTGKRLRHPVYGHRDRWVDQTEGVDPAVFMGRFEEQTPQIRQEILRILNDIAQKVATG